LLLGAGRAVDQSRMAGRSGDGAVLQRTGRGRAQADEVPVRGRDGGGAGGGGGRDRGGAGGAVCGADRGGGRVADPGPVSPAVVRLHFFGGVAGAAGALAAARAGAAVAGGADDGGVGEPARRILHRGGGAGRVRGGAGGAGPVGGRGTRPRAAAGRARDLRRAGYPAQPLRPEPMANRRAHAAQSVHDGRRRRIPDFPERPTRTLSRWRSDLAAFVRVGANGGVAGELRTGPERRRST